MPFRRNPHKSRPGGHTGRLWIEIEHRRMQTSHTGLEWSSWGGNPIILGPDWKTASGSYVMKSNSDMLMSLPATERDIW